MNKKIWFICKYCGSNEDQYSRNRGFNLMRNIAEKGNQVTFITSFDNSNSQLLKFKNSSKLFSLKNLNLVVIKILRYKKKHSFFRILSWIHFELKLFFLDKSKFSKPDFIIVSSLSFFTILNGIYLKKKYKCKLVFEIRDIWPLTLMEVSKFKSYNPIIIVLSFIEKIGYMKSDFIVGTMPKLIEHVEKILGYKKSVNCIPMGVSKEWLENKNQSLPGYFNRHINKNDFNVIYAGSIGISHALDTLFKAAEILNKNSNIKFIIVGDGDLRKNYIKKYGYLSNVTYFPEIKNRYVNSILQLASVVYFSCHNSKVMHYGQSINKVIDYMLSGKTIVASYSGYRTMINEANCGFFVEAEQPRALAEKLIELSNMPTSDLNKIGMRGRHWLIKNRKYEILADNYMKLMFSNKK